MHLVIASHYFSYKLVVRCLRKVEMMKIDELPTEILIKIFGYLRSYGDVSLVNRRFYGIACSVDDSVSFSSIFEENGNYRSVMDSVENTRRKITKLFINVGDYRHQVGLVDDTSTQCLIRESAISDAVKIVKQFSATIKHFELRRVRMEMSDFLEVLSWLPNAEHLVFSYVSKRNPTDRQLSNECLDLHRLKKLKFYGCSQELVVVFSRLPAGVLKKLTIFHYENINWDLLAGLFQQQSNIKELKLLIPDDSTLPDHIFGHLRLESLELYQREYNSRHATILSRQTKLISLSLFGAEADDQILNAITSQLSELETLGIQVNDRQVIPFKKIEKLKKLKELTLQTSSLTVIETLAGFDNSRITILDIKNIDTREIMSVDVIAALANSLPNQKVLRCDFSFSEYQIIAVVMQHFNFLEVLTMRFGVSIDATGLCQAIEVDRCFNPKLTELKIEYFSCDESVLTKLAAFYPNIKNLYILGLSSITPSSFKAILTGFKKMESLRLVFLGWPFSTEYVECITKHKNNLKSMTLSFLECEFTAEDKQKLSAVFDVLIYQSRTLHLSN